MQKTHSPEMKEKRTKRVKQRRSFFMVMVVGYRASSLCRGNVHSHESRALQERGKEREKTSREGKQTDMHVHACLHVSMNACMSACVYECMSACMCPCMYVGCVDVDACLCSYVSMNAYAFMYV
jgi:hypothetical protein